MQKWSERIRVARMRDAALAVRLGTHAGRKDFEAFSRKTEEDEKPKVSGYAYFKALKGGKGRRSGKQK